MAEDQHRNTLFETRSKDYAPIFLGESLAIRSLLNKAEAIVWGPQPILIYGADGTGKCKLAHLIHSISKTHAHPLRVIDLAMIDPHEHAHYLFGSPNRTTSLALDSRSNQEPENLLIKNCQLLSKCDQTKLWAYLNNEKTVLDPTRRTIGRLILTTSACPMELNQKGLLTDALFEALWFQFLPMPSLNARRTDLPEIIDYYVSHFSAMHGKPGLRLSEASRSFLLQLNYKQHFDQLANMIETGVLLSSGKSIHLPEEKLARKAKRNFNLSPRLWIKRSS